MRCSSTKPTDGLLPALPALPDYHLDSIDPRYLQRREEILESVNGFTVTPTNADEANELSDQLVEARRFVKEVEAARVQFKKPVMDLGRQIDSLAKELTEGVESAIRDRSRLIAAWSEAEARRVRDEELKRQEEIRKAQEEHRRKEAEAQQLMSKANTQEQINAAVKAEIEAESCAQRVEEAIIQPLPEKTKAAGMVTREVIHRDIEDEAKFIEWCLSPKGDRRLLRIEPNRQAINTMIMPGMDVPGLKVWKENVAAPRAR